MKYSNEIDEIISTKNKNGGKFWSRGDGDIHAPNGSSTIDTLMVLGELGAKTQLYPAIHDAVDFILSYQMDDGLFKYSKVSSKLPCITARILSALGRLGVSKNDTLERSYLLLLDTQHMDGGWRCNTVKMGKSPQWDASNPGTTLYTLDAFRFRKNSREDIEKLDKAVNFLLEHWTYKKPLGPCNFGIGSRFKTLEYPFLRYNLFYYVYVLSFYPQAIKDRRFREALEILNEKVSNGKVIPENPHRYWRRYSFAKKGRTSQMASVRWDEIQSNLFKNQTYGT